MHFESGTSIEPSRVKERTPVHARRGMTIVTSNWSRSHRASEVTSGVRPSCVTCRPNSRSVQFSLTHHHSHDLPLFPCGSGVAMARSQATIIFAVALVANVLLLRQSGLTSVAVQQHDLQDFGAGRSLFRRGLFTTASERSGESVRPYPSIWSFSKFMVH